MGSEFHLKAFQGQAAAFRAAALQAGPDAPVSTCSGWDVRRMVQHLARVYASVRLALETEPDGERPEVPRPPTDFDEAVAWWDDRCAELVTALSTMEPDRPVWSFFAGGTPASWTRRMAHETAIHRLDAEHALAGLGPDLVHELIFDPELAADGIDEMLDKILPLGDWSQTQHEGTVLYHAPDAGKAWLVTYRPGERPVTESPHGAALEVDATVAGTADAVYRRVWGRPSTAMVTGDAALASVAAGR
ncbi:maleylpyruvate isomerase N-terminal domain-containing protein [Saccharopolyspora griseoalba]|uniref:Maleylpyruvate isomerase N-terminal domain-containing protein n=1 Tax=Saccharopolyspora griseoalba TaxID=1431848 RepID=A0ABW2LGE1_9PSEU